MQFNDILSADQLLAYFRAMHVLDPAMARKSLDWYRTKTRAQLEEAASQAWYANEREAYVLAKSFAALNCEAVGALRNGLPLHQIVRGILD